MINWKKRQAYLVTERFGAEAGRFLKAYRRPDAPAMENPPAGRLPYRQAALAFAREKGIEKKGPPRRGRYYWPWPEGGFGVFNCSGSRMVVLEGPPEPDGRRPGWEFFADWTRREIEPGLFRLSPPSPGEVAGE